MPNNERKLENYKLLRGYKAMRWQGAKVRVHIHNMPNYPAFLGYTEKDKRENSRIC